MTNCIKPAVILVTFLFTLTVAFGAGGKVNLNSATPEELDGLPGVGPYTAKEIIKMRPITDINALLSIRGMKPEEVEILKGLVTLGNEQSQVSAVTPEFPVSSQPTTTTAPAKDAKKILYITSTDLNQADRALITGLRAEGLDVVVASKAGFKLTNETVHYTGKTDNRKTEKEGSLPDPVPDIVIGTAPNTRLPAGAVVWDDSMLAQFAGFIFADVGKVAKLGLPIQKILSSNKVIVLGEARSIQGGESELLGSDGDKSRSGTVKPYGVETSMRTIRFNIYYHTWKQGMKMPTDSETQMFVEKELVPRIKAGL